MEQAVIAYIPLRKGSFVSEHECAEIADLTAKLQQAIDHHGVGEFDGDEFGGGRCVLFMYGRDADQLFGVVAPILKAVPLTRGGFVIKRYGEAKDPDAVEVRVDL
ncbi:hypothetical protein SSBR45G_03400 [Bradyrhizobium sp. SSBR45G]|uniref:hypothetical protein n=1 Tax=unclassified Bradyrhizobium TaxID=2631580 RepID=UPI002342B918|nr:MULTISPECIES: hypothetical protein [unclassified Bradyrhizobium]GLH75432.1 hypothetical protein SSBR45G_03400 [Bradyrhizobium sp. SSBR45G]GLH82781.1 hypothetical protein SSBR45R_02410 [Bradyrhizobium sp. SSBR45R]